MFDPELYQSKSEVEEWKKRCPIETFTRLLKKQGFLTDTELDAMEARVASEIVKAVDFAEAGTWEPVEELMHFVYSDRRTE